MLERPTYFTKLKSYRNKKLIKVISGIRRCGKSTLLQMFQDYLRQRGVTAAQIIAINFEDPDYEHLTDASALYKYLKKKLTPKKNYIFLDEIQNVPNFQKAVDGLYIKDNVDLYITGSNAYFMSGELATLLSGRYIEIAMLPLSFSEYLSAFPEQNDLPQKYRAYLENSSFPYSLAFNNDHEQIREYLGGIYNTVILKDVVKRKNIADVSSLESIIRFMFANIGNITSTKKISDTLTSLGRKISNHTVENYLSALTDCFILYRAGRFEVKGKQYLQRSEKYYLVDIGLRYFLLGTQKTDHGHILENVIYLELLRRGYEVYVGKINTLEVDFVAIKNGDISYYQVAQTAMATKTLQRELAPLLSIKDHCPKFLLTLDNVPLVTHHGIKQIYALDWLRDG